MGGNGIILHLDSGRKCSIITATPGSSAFIFTWTLLSLELSFHGPPCCGGGFLHFLRSLLSSFYSLPVRGHRRARRRFGQQLPAGSAVSRLMSIFFFFYYLKSHMDARQAWLITLHPSDFKTRAPATTGPLYSEWKPPRSHTPAVKRTERMASSILKPLYRTREVSWQCVFVERRWRAANRSVRKATSSGLWLLPVHKVCQWTLLEASRKKRFIQRSKSTFLKSRCYKIRFPVRPTMLKHGCYTRTEAS